MPRKKKGIGWQWWLVIAAAVLAILYYTPTGDYVILPGITENLNRIVTVQGGKVPRHGRFLMVAVTLDRANLLDDIMARVTPYGEIVPAAQILPPGGHLSQFIRMSAIQMKESHEYAQVAGLRSAGYNAREAGNGVEVEAVLSGFPAVHRLKVGDVILAVDGHAVTMAHQLLDRMAALPRGAVVTLTLRRSGRVMQVRVPTTVRPSVSPHPMVGVEVATYEPHFVIPVPIHIATGDITGPSAGMMFSLEILSQVRPGLHLTRDRVVAGTGTITANGTVGPIGGVREKVVTVYRAGARVFLVPRANYRSATQEARWMGIQHKLRIIPVSNLSQAVQALRALPPAPVASGRDSRGDRAAY